MQNLGLKVLALAIAILLSLFVHGEGNSSQIKLLVPIELGSLPRDRVVVSASRTQAEVTVRGPAFLVSRIAMNPPIVKAGIPDATSDQFNLKLTRQHIDLPWGLHLVSIDPPEVSFKLEDVITRVVPVIVPRFGLIPRTHELSKIEVFPDQVETRGQRSMVAGISRIETEPLELPLISESFERTVLLRSPSDSVRLSIPTVRISVKFEPKIITRQFVKLPIRFQGPPGTTFKPGVVSVQLRGPATALQNLSGDDLSPTVEALTPAKGQELTVSLVVPPELSIESIEPEVVRITKIAK